MSDPSPWPAEPGMWLALGHIWTCSDTAWIPGTFGLKDRTPAPARPEAMAGNPLLQAVGLPWQHGWRSFPAPLHTSRQAPQESWAKLPPQLLLAQVPSITGDHPPGHPHHNSQRPLRPPLCPGRNWAPDPLHQVSHSPNPNSHSVYSWSHSCDHD